MTADLARTSETELRLLRDLADWNPLLTPVGDFVEEAAFCRRLCEKRRQQPPRTLLDLGSDTGNEALFGLHPADSGKA